MSSYDSDHVPHPLFVPAEFLPVVYFVVALGAQSRRVPRLRFLAFTSHHVAMRYLDAVSSAQDAVFDGGDSGEPLSL